MKYAGLMLLFALIAQESWSQSSTEKRLDSLWIAGEYRELVLQTQRHTPLTPWMQIKKAEALTALAEYEAARELLERVAPQTPASLQAAYETALASFELVTGRADLALERLQSAWARQQKEGVENTVQAARTLSLLSTALSSQGQYNEAIRFGERALAIRQHLPELMNEELAASYNDLGLVYSKIDPDRALFFFDQALPLYASLHGAVHPKIAIINTNIGSVYSDLKLYGDAISNFETALAIWQKRFPQGHPNEAFVRLNLGRIYSRLNNPAATKTFYRQALVLYQRNYGTSHPDIANTFNQLGVVLLEEAKYDSALDYFQQALISNSAGFRSRNVAQFPGATDYYNGQVLLFSLQQKSRALEARYSGKTLAPKDLTGALYGLQVCDTLIDRLRQRNENERDKIALSGLAKEVYQDGVRISKTLSEVTTRSSAYRELCFYFAEKSKSAVLQEAIADTRAKAFAGIPVALLEEERKWKASIAQVAQKISAKPEPEEERKLRGQLFDLNAMYQQFIRKLEQDYPAYFNLKYKRTIPTVKELQLRLDQHAALVSYFLEEGETGNPRVYVFTLTKKTFRIESRTLNQSVQRLLTGFTNGLYFSDVAVFREAGNELNRWLNPHLPLHIRELTIIPDSQFGTLPFEALPRHRRYASFADASYWTDRYAISYQFSSGLLATHPRPAEAARVYLSAPIDFEFAGLPGLPGTQEEVRSIAHLFAGRADVDEFSEAGELPVKADKLRDYDYLHFATHGVVDAVRPELSRLILHPSDQEDGSLYSGEIYNLQLRAHLAVLSACQTGLGKVSKGEGVIGLSRALVYAGVRNLIVSFWRVADTSTMVLMRSFYEHVQTHPQATFRSSLQAAKAKLRKTNAYGSPFYWAPFVLIGS